MKPLPMAAEGAGEPAPFPPYPPPPDTAGRTYPAERFKNIELEINTACDLACFACDRFSDVAAKGVPNMTVAQVRRFVTESLDENWEWERIRLLGGEPTIHPHFREIAELLTEYRRAYPKVFLQVLSNGQGKLAAHRDWLLAKNIDPHVEGKQRGVQPKWFYNTRITPLDREPSVGAVEPCGIFGLRGCGIGLTRHGYFLDGAGASIARVAGYDVGVMNLREVTWEAMIRQAHVLCRVCGHWNPPTGPVVVKKVTETGQVTGAFWTEALARYARERPRLRVYGEDSGGAL